MDAEATHGTGASYGNRLLEAETRQTSDLELPDLTPRSAEVTVPIQAADASKGPAPSSLRRHRGRRASTVHKDDRDKTKKNDRDTKSMHELLRLLCSIERPELKKRFTDSLPQNSKVSDISCAFHHHCGPLILENRIIGPDSWHSASSDKETTKKTKETKPKQHKYTGPEHPYLFEADGFYQGEQLENGKPNGWGLWVSVSSFEQHFEKGKRKGFQDPLSVTILWGNWKDMELTEGSMLHAYVPDMNGPFWPVQRCVGFSYKGRLSLNKTETDNLHYELKFDCNDQENSATFREFEFAAIKMALQKKFLPKTKQNGDSLEPDIEPQDPEFPLQVWVELFCDSLLDDGLERKGCRNYGEHRKIFEQTPKLQDSALALSANPKVAVNAGFIEFLTSNYIGAGLQYFVPRIVDGTHAHFEIVISHSYCQHNTNTIALFLCHICNYSQI
jgi:hypothetical protein